MSELLELHTKCSICKREMPDQSIFYKHPKYGIVCEYCPEFNDGVIKIDEPSKEENEN